MARLVKSVGIELGALLFFASTLGCQEDQKKIEFLMATSCAIESGAVGEDCSKFV